MAVASADVEAEEDDSKKNEGGDDLVLVLDAGTNPNASGAIRSSKHGRCRVLISIGTFASLDGRSNATTRSVCDEGLKFCWRTEWLTSTMVTFRWHE